MLPHKIQLQEKYSKNSNFQKEMQQTEIKYKELLQRAIYSDLSEISPKLIVEAGKDQEQHPVFFIFGQEQPKKKKQTDKLYLYLINFFEGKINNKQHQSFSIVYFNTCCESYTNYSTFRSIYRTLPLKYFENLKKLIIVDPSFTVKAMEWFVSGTINKLLHNLTIYVDHLKQLKEHNIIMTTNKLSLLPKYITEEKQKDIMRLSVRQSVNLRISKKNPERRKTTRKLKLEDYECNQIGVPIALYLMISYFLIRKQGLKEEGLFRKSVIRSQIDEAMQFVKQKYYDFLQQITNPHIVANLMTKFIGDFAEPLIPCSIYEKLIHDNGQATKVSYLKDIFNEYLPFKNQVTLLYFFDFLIEEVVPLKQFNKMTTYNLAVVMAPCLLQSGKDVAIQELMYSKKLVLIMQFILNNYEQVFGSKQQRLRVFRKSSQVQKKRFLQQNVEGKEKHASISQSQSNRSKEEKHQQQPQQDQWPKVKQYRYSAEYMIGQDQQKK